MTYRQKILIVDDNADNLEILKDKLESMNYEVLTASSGEEAISRVESGRPDLILLDIMMPGMDGYEVCRILKGQPSTRFIPIAMVTAKAGSDEIIKGLDSGADDYITKPIDIPELMARVKSLLRIKSLHDSVESRNKLLYKILNRYVAEDVVTQIIRNPDKHLRLGGEIRRVTIVFADISGFTGFSEKSHPGEIVKFLNEIFPRMIDTIYKYKGTFDKYIGDAIMAFYDTSGSGGCDDDYGAMGALNTALEIRKIFYESQKRWQGKRLEVTGISIGVNTGEALVGNIGSEKIMDYTVIGDTVNMARRIQENAAVNQILIGEDTYRLVKDRVETKELQLQLKNRAKPVKVYALLEITG